MIKRKAYEAALRLAGQFPVVVITGPRQSGKTTLAKTAFPQKRYVSFDDKNMREIAGSDPGAFLKAFSEGAVIDEAQKVPEIFDAVKLVVDSGEYEPGKFILTGSSQFRMKQNIADSLAGRIGTNFYLNKLKDVMGVTGIKVVAGVRRCGKSKALEAFMTYVHASDLNANIVHINFNINAYERLNDYHALSDHVEKAKRSGNNNFVFIDEVNVCS